MFGIHYFTNEYAIYIEYKVLISRVLFVLGALTAMMGLLAFRAKGTTSNPTKPEEASALVTGGIYRATRNPMYLGMVLILVGGMIRTANPLTLLAVVFFIWYITQFQIKPEEDVLSEKFGEEYEQYRSKVRRWI